MSARPLAAARLLAAGAVLPTGTALPAAVVADILDARAYAHPALPGAPIVRLVAPALAPGDDLVMDFLGCAAPPVTAGIGAVQRRAPGFPGWALINDPKHARHALDVVKAMKAAGRRARSKPGHAWDGFAALAAQLGRSVRHFLPSYWEECGRVFLAAGNVHYAGRCFGKAREAEQVHALKVDLAAQRESFLEFSLRGAVAVKALAEFARQVAAGHGAATAWATMRELCLRRCQGGVPPWAGMLGELADLAAKAGEERAAALRALLVDLLPLPAVLRAPLAFWTAAEPGLAALAREPAWARPLLELAPQPEGGSDYLFTWVARLAGWGLIEHLVAERLPDGSAIDAVAWFERLIARTHQRWWSPPDLPDHVFALAERLLPHLRAAGRPLLLWRLVSFHDHRRALADPDLLRLALDHGLALADPPEGVDIGYGLTGWADPDGVAHPARRRDPAALLDHPRWGPPLAEEASGALEADTFTTLVVGLPRLFAACRAWALAAIAEAAAGGLPAIAELIGIIGKRFKPAFLAAAPEVRQRLAEVAVAANLGRTLRAGVIDEFGWPALEESIARLQRDDPANPDEWPWVGGQAPYVVVTDGIRVEVVGPEAVVLRHDLTLPAGANLRMVQYRDRQLLIAFQFDYSKRFLAWSQAPTVHHPHEHYLSHDFGHAQVDLADGGTTAGGRAVHAGEVAPTFQVSALVGDGRAFWRLRSEAGRHELREFDPRTGEDGRTSLPSFFEDGLRGQAAGGELDLAHSHLLPLGPHVDASPLGGRNGLAGVRVLTTRRADGASEQRIEGIDGRSWRGAPVDGAVALLRFPGATAPTLLVDQGYRRHGCGLAHTDGWRLSDGSPAFTYGQAAALPLHFLHALRARDAAGSAALRALGDEAAAALLESALGELPPLRRADEESDDDQPTSPDDAGLPRTAARLGELLPAVTHPRLRRGLLGLLHHAAGLARALRTAVSGDDDAVAEKPADAQAKTAMGTLDWQHATRGSNRRPATDLRRQAAFLRAAPAADGRLDGGIVGWWARIGELPSRGLALTMGDDESRGALAALLDLWIECGLDALPGRWRMGILSGDHDKPPVPLNGSWSTRGAVLWQDGNAFLLISHTWNTLALCEYAPGGEFRGLREAAFGDTVDLVLPTAAWCARWRDALRAGAAPGLDAATLTAIAEALGCPRALAALIVLGFARLDRKEDRERRDALGLKAGEVKAAQELADAIEPAQRAALAQALLGDDPAGLWALGQPGADGATPIARLAAAWRAIAADSQPLELVELGGWRFGSAHTAALRRLARAVAGGAALARAPIQMAWDGDSQQLNLVAMGGDDAADAALVDRMRWVARDVHLHQPVGSQTVVGLLPLIAAIGSALADDELRWSLGDVPTVAEHSARLAAAAWDGLHGCPETVVSDDADGRFLKRDGGLLVMVHGNGAFGLAFRPARLLTDADAQRLRALVVGGFYRLKDDGIDVIESWRAAPFQRLLARLASSPLPAGAFEANPLHSAPAVVAAAMKRLKLGEDAAVAYLQVLALAAPTAARLARWNGWPSDRVEAALAADAKAKLLIQAKRARAGREHFLPGGWEDLKDPYAPMETWKLALHGGRREKKELVLPPGPLLPTEPLHELFARAWARIESGDAPRYEEVR